MIRSEKIDARRITTDKEYQFSGSQINLMKQARMNDARKRVITDFIYFIEGKYKVKLPMKDLVEEYLSVAFEEDK